MVLSDNSFSWNTATLSWKLVDLLLMVIWASACWIKSVDSAMCVSLCLLLVRAALKT